MRLGDLGGLAEYSQAGRISSSFPPSDLPPERDPWTALADLMTLTSLVGTDDGQLLESVFLDCMRSCRDVGGYARAGYMALLLTIAQPHTRDYARTILNRQLRSALGTPMGLSNPRNIRVLAQILDIWGGDAGLIRARVALLEYLSVAAQTVSFDLRVAVVCAREEAAVAGTHGNFKILATSLGRISATGLAFHLKGDFSLLRDLLLVFERCNIPVPSSVCEYVVSVLPASRFSEVGEPLLRAVLTRRLAWRIGALNFDRSASHAPA